MQQSGTFKLGPNLTIEASAYGSQGNAILGIRDSGKTFTATSIAEHLFDCGVPFITLDPTGVWRWLRVPGKGKGYPVVVAGKDGDLPLTVAGAPEITRAAMRNGVSIVFDLTDPSLSKADWRRIVKATIRTLLQENAPHGLRHVFIEEAAEFAPQRVIDGDVYAEVEKLARIGGNARLGYTLVNQRSQEVNKAVLELCENLFLHRQRGKNAIQGLDHWLDIAGVEGKDIVKSLPQLPSGQCWAWMGDRAAPVLVKVPAKNSAHPDRRVMRGADVAAKKAIDVGGFVSDMRSTLATVEAEAKANDPAALRGEIARLQSEKNRLEKTINEGSKFDPAASAAAENKGFERGFDAGMHEGARQMTAASMDETEKLGHAFRDAVNDMLRKKLAGLPFPKMAAAPRPTPTAPRRPLAHVIPASKKAAEPKPAPTRSIAKNGDAGITGPQSKVLQAMRWWLAMGHAEPSRRQVAAIAGWKPTGSNLSDRLSELKTAGMVTYPKTGHVAMTDLGVASAPDPDMTANVVDGVRSVLTDPQRKVFDAMLEAHGAVDRKDLAETLGWQVGGSNLSDRLSELKGMDIVRYPSRGIVEVQPWVVGQ